LQRSLAGLLVVGPTIGRKPCSLEENRKTLIGASTDPHISLPAAAAFAAGLNFTP
jgi:hypothetical protein